MNDSPLPPIEDILPPLPETVPVWQPAIWTTAGLLLLAGAIWVIRRLLRRAPAPAPSPECLFHRELDRIAGLAAALDPYAVAVAVSDALRDCLAAIDPTLARSHTSSEFLATVAQSGRFGPERQARLAEFLRIADRIKFARTDASPESVRILLDTARGLVVRPPDSPPQS